MSLEKHLMEFITHRYSGLPQNLNYFTGNCEKLTAARVACAVAYPSEVYELIVAYFQEMAKITLDCWMVTAIKGSCNEAGDVLIMVHGMYVDMHTLRTFQHRIDPELLK